jgi:hypothetical protein
MGIPFDRTDLHVISATEAIVTFYRDGAPVAVRRIDHATAKELIEKLRLRPATVVQGLTVQGSYGGIQIPSGANVHLENVALKDVIVGIDAGDDVTITGTNVEIETFDHD